MSDITKPTIGRRVWFRPHPDLTRGMRDHFVCLDEQTPMDAGIVFVWHDRMVNLDVCDHAGNHHAITSVELWHGDCDRPNYSFAEWMPYQKGQAAKTEQVMASMLNGHQAGDTIQAKAPADTTYSTFGSALSALKAGRKVAREGWNGKGMWLKLIAPIGPGRRTIYVVEDFADSDLLPWIGMKTADSKFVPWLASQTDMLAEDWVLVAEPEWREAGQIPTQTIAGLCDPCETCSHCLKNGCIPTQPADIGTRQESNV